MKKATALLLSIIFAFSLASCQLFSSDDKKEYARRFGKVMRIVAASPVISGVIFLICSLFTDNGDILILAAVISLIVSFMVCLGLGAGLMYKDDPDRSGDQPKE